MNKKIAALLAGATVFTVLTVGCSQTTTKAVETPGSTTAEKAATEAKPGEPAASGTAPAASSVEQSSVAAPSGAPAASGTPVQGEAAAAPSTAPAGTSQTPVGGEAAGSRSEAMVTPPAATSGSTSSVPVAPAGTPTAGNSYNLNTIYFDFDKSNIRPDAKSVLDANFEVLSKNASFKVQVVGHCDERGSNEYNMALGERRAVSTKNYLMNRGIAADRLSTLSKGEEEPVDPGHDEAAWAKNRRAQFVGQ